MDLNQDAEASCAEKTMSRKPIQSNGRGEERDDAKRLEGGVEEKRELEVLPALRMFEEVDGNLKVLRKASEELSE
jgi:hypothetical protein